MSLEWIRGAYQVPARVGVRVRYTGGKTPCLGTIEGSNGAHVKIRLDGESRAQPYHPTWRLEYLDREPVT